MTFAEQAARIVLRRARNPLREFRRQAELARMSKRYDSLPIYRDTYDRDGGRIIASRYIGHVVIYAS